MGSRDSEAPARRSRRLFVLVVIMALGLPFVTFLFMNLQGNRRIHRNAIRADCLMTIAKQASVAHTELMHGLGEGGASDRQAATDALSEAMDTADLLTDGGVCKLGCPIEPLEDEVHLEMARQIKSCLEVMIARAAMMEDAADSSSPPLTIRLFERTYLDMMEKSRNLGAHMEGVLLQSSLDVRRFTMRMGALWLIASLVSLVGLWKHERTLLKAADGLRAGERRFRNLFESATDVIFVMDLGGNFIDVNTAACARLGYTKQEMLSMNISDIVHPEYAGMLSDRMARLSEQGVAVFDSAHVANDGTVMSVEVNCRLLEHEGRKAFLSIVRDITERKQAEDRLRQSESRFRAAFENAAVGASMADLNGRFIKVNAFLCNLVGYSEEEMLARTFSDITYPEDVEVGLVNMRRMISGEIDQASFDKRYVRKDGSLINLIVSPSIIRNDKGNPMHFIALFQDVTESRKAEEALLESEERYRTLVETAPYGIQIAGRDGLIVFSNEVHHRIQGYDKGEIAGKKYVWDFIASAPVREETRQYYKILMEEQPEPQVVFNKDLTRDGRLIDTQINWNYIRNGRGEVVGTYAIISDITERRQAEEKIIESLKEKKVLLKEIHHRVKNNMAIISALLQLQSRYSGDHKAVQILKDSQNRINSMALIHEQLYQTDDFAYLNFREYAGRLVRHILHTFGKTPGEPKVELEIDDVAMSIDSIIPCGLIINELLTNSLKYAFDGIGDPEIGISLKAEGGAATLSYWDNGVGLPEHVRFPDSDTLGLQIINMLATQQRGTVGLERQGGTRFTISLKLATREHEAE